jgi:hypothetical protein
MVFTSSCETKQSSIKRTSKEFITAILTKDYKKAETYLYCGNKKYGFITDNKEELYKYFDNINRRILIQNIFFNEYEFENDNFTIVFNTFNDNKVVINFYENKTFGYGITNIYVY